MYAVSCTTTDIDISLPGGEAMKLLNLVKARRIKFRVESDFLFCYIVPQPREREKERERERE